MGPCGNRSTDGIHEKSNNRPDANSPYYAAIFTSLRTEGYRDYGITAVRMHELVVEQPSFLGVKDNLGISVFCGSSKDVIFQWNRQLEHLEAQQQGRNTWYRRYRVRVSKVEREYEHPASDPLMPVENQPNASWG